MANRIRLSKKTSRWILLHPWQFLLIGVAGWINRSQQQAIEYPRTENQILREVVGKKRILLNDDQRRRLAVKGKVLGLRRLRDLAGIVTPETPSGQTTQPCLKRQPRFALEVLPR